MMTFLVCALWLWSVTRPTIDSMRIAFIFLSVSVSSFVFSLLFSCCLGGTQWTLEIAEWWLRRNKQMLRTFCVCRYCCCCCGFCCCWCYCFNSSYGSDFFSLHFSSIVAAIFAFDPKFVAECEHQKMCANTNNHNVINIIITIMGDWKYGIRMRNIRLKATKTGDELYIERTSTSHSWENNEKLKNVINSI